MWNSLEIKLLCRDHGNDYEVSVSLSLHAHISLSNATRTSFNKCIKNRIDRVFIPFDTNQKSENKDYIRTV